MIITSLGDFVAVFERDEYARRQAAIHKAMAAASLDLLVVTNPPNMNYCVGYDAWSFYVPQAVLLPVDAPPVWIGRAIDLECARHTTVLPEDALFGYGDSYLAKGRHGADYIAEIIRDRFPAARQIGVEMDSPYFTAQYHGRLSAGLSGKSLIDADTLINWVRTVKSEAEIAVIRQAGEITDIAMRRAIDLVAPGVRQSEVAGAIYEALINGHPDFCGDVPDFQTLPMGARTSAPHLTWTDERFESGSTCTLELGANRFRYHAPLARTVHIGRPAPDLLNLATVVEDGLGAALDAVHPGALACDVANAWNAVIRRAGIEKPSRIGYSVGIGYPPDWGERTISLIATDKTSLQENMVLHLMLGLWGRDGGYELSETFVIEAGGASCLSRIDRALVIKPD